MAELVSDTLSFSLKMYQMIPKVQKLGFLHTATVTSRSRRPVLVLSQRILLADVATNKCSVEAGEKQTFSAESR